MTIVAAIMIAFGVFYLAFGIWGPRQFRRTNLSSGAFIVLMGFTILTRGIVSLIFISGALALSILDLRLQRNEKRKVASGPGP
jgi:hypothetical protein